MRSKVKEIFIKRGLENEKAEELTDLCFKVFEKRGENPIDTAYRIASILI